MAIASIIGHARNVVLLIGLSFFFCPGVGAADLETDKYQALWFQRFQFSPITSGEIPPDVRNRAEEVTFSVRVEAPGRQFIRVSLPFPHGKMKETQKVLLQSHDGHRIVADCRVLTTHGGGEKFIRRALLSFLDDFQQTTRHYTVLSSFAEQAGRNPNNLLKVGANTFQFDGQQLLVRRDEEPPVRISVFPRADHSTTAAVKEEVIERGSHYLWVRWLQWDGQFPRILELRANSVGQYAVRALLQSWKRKDGYAPQFGLSIEGDGQLSYTLAGRNQPLEQPLTLEWKDQQEISFQVARLGQVRFPDAVAWRKGAITAEPGIPGWKITYFRTREQDQVPHQPMAWRLASMYVGPSDMPPWNELLEPPLAYSVPASSWAATYGCQPVAEPENDILKAVLAWHRNAMAVARLYGDDFGNVTTLPENSVFGMNRLNHNTEIFFEFLRTANPDIRKTFLLWCQNYATLSIWWGNLDTPAFGGTRYNNMKRDPTSGHADDDSFMWRSNSSVSFCTKGIENFLFAYEETGDPLYAVAFHAQVEYAQKSIHAVKNLCRNIGVAKDFMLLYRAQGKEEYAQHALRLFRELRDYLTEEHLFSESGRPFEKEPPFIQFDETGQKHPFPKPYILGYALQGLPALYKKFPDEPRLVDTIRAVARFLAENGDPTGGWRYPHPRSPWVLIRHKLEHAYQLVEACSALKDKPADVELCLDRIEVVLQARIAAVHRFQQPLDDINPWEYAIGKFPATKNLEEVYKRFEERDHTRDYSEGTVSLTRKIPPEGVVYFAYVLDFYLKHRRPERLLTGLRPELEKVLSRLAATEN